MQDINAAVARLTASSPEAELADVILAIQNSQDISSETIALLAEKMATSGESYDLHHPYLVDVASTGGPSSLTTLLTPIYLAEYGMTVPKVAVPGRPAG